MDDDWKQLPVNRQTGQITWLNMATGEIRTRQPVGHVIEANKERADLLHDQRLRRRRTQDHMHHVAEIPENVAMWLREEGILDDPQAMRKWLNDPDNAVFRVDGGRRL